MDNIIELETGPEGDDAASKILQGKWRIPTEEEWAELMKCTWTWSDNYDGSGVKGRIVKADNGNSIFLPAAGYREGSNLKEEGSIGRYWTSSLDTSYPLRAMFVEFQSAYVRQITPELRQIGLQLRPVCQ